MMKPDLKMMEQTRALFLLLLYVTHYWPPCKETVATRIFHTIADNIVKDFPTKIKVILGQRSYLNQTTCF